MDCEVIGWCALKPEAQAAWVQAIGSIIAIAVAIGVPYYLHRVDRARAAKKDELRARSFALALLPHAEKFAAQLRSARVVANDIDGPDGPDLNEAARIAAVPDALQDRVTELHELGDPAVYLQAAIAKSSEARQRLNYAAFYYDQGGEYWDSRDGGVEKLSEPDDYSQSLSEAQQHLASAISGMQAMFL